MYLSLSRLAIVLMLPVNFLEIFNFENIFETVEFFKKVCKKMHLIRQMLFDYIKESLFFIRITKIKIYLEIAYYGFLFHFF